ncbi:hypothetical protein KNP414_01437 [Paenibacillus mucilaginosus KNP414]|uniref:Uncharacterized protein n=1 Tax=Paenibacillus mucilaginosus (strain KNP414) TaxID=1036673 RepID=F8FL82_PAEMK|nr:hypothetical protein KNP414_01437 [Paenibacillus mucilaginosus KNP414]
MRIFVLFFLHKKRRSGHAEFPVLPALFPQGTGVAGRRRVDAYGQTW